MRSVSDLSMFLHKGYPEGKSPVQFARYTGQEKRDARKRSGAGRAGGSRSTLIVPVKRGNSSYEEPVEGSGVPRIRN